MKKTFMIAICLIAVITARAGDGDEFFTLNGGFLFNSTVNATFGYERELDYGNAVELFGEVGDRWHEDPTCGKICNKIFWKDYYWGGGILYKKSLKRFKNSTLRLRFGPECGSHKGDFYFGLEGGFEYNYVFPSGVHFTVIQKNNVNFNHGDTFRNGILIGLKIPF